MQSLHAKQLGGYGVTALPLAIVGLPLYVYLPTFYAKESALDIATIGLVLMGVRFIDMLIDPLLGHWSDRLHRPLGSRKSMMLIAAVVLIAAFYLLIHPPQSFVALWMGTFSLLTYIGWSALSIPYLAWSAQISPYYHDKTRLAISRESFGALGVVISLLLPYLLHLSNESGSTLMLLWSLLLVLLPLSMGITFTTLSAPPHQTRHTPALETLSNLFKEAQVRRFFLAYLLNNTANALPATLFLLFVETYIRRPDMSGLLLLLYFAAGLVALPLWNRVAQRIGKKRAWIASMLLASAAFVWIPFLQEDSLAVFIIICLVSGLSLGADMALPSAIGADMAQRFEARGTEAGGTLFGLWAMLSKLAMGIGVGIAFGVLGLFDFDAHHPDETALFALALLYGTLPVVLKVLTLMTLRGFDDEVTSDAYENGSRSPTISR